MVKALKDILRSMTYRCDHTDCWDRGYIPVGLLYHHSHYLFCPEHAKEKFGNHEQHVGVVCTPAYQDFLKRHPEYHQEMVRLIGGERDVT